MLDHLSYAKLVKETLDKQKEYFAARNKSSVNNLQRSQILEESKRLEAELYKETVTQISGSEQKSIF